MTDDHFNELLKELFRRYDENNDTPDEQNDQEGYHIGIEDRTVGVGYIPGAERLTTYSVDRLQKALELLEVLEVEMVDVLTIKNHSDVSDDVMLAFEPRTNRHRIHGETYVMAAPRVNPGGSDE